MTGQKSFHAEINGCHAVSMTTIAAADEFGCLCKDFCAPRIIQYFVDSSGFHWIALIVDRIGLNVF